MKITDDKRRFIYTYFPDFDMNCHHFGTKSKEVKDSIIKFDNYVKKLYDIVNENTTIIVTADHGLVDIPENKLIIYNQHKKLMNCLSQPVCGETRASFMYVKPEKTKEFENYINTKFKDAFILKKRDEIIDEKLFGLYTENPRLRDRIGDYVLLAKENYAGKDIILSEEIRYPKACHGGLSKQEMIVPLIVIKK